MSPFTLSSSPDLLCEDRFDIVGSDDLQVPFWEILTAILRPDNPIDDVATLIETLETIRACLRGHTKDFKTANSDYDIIDTDYEYLREFLSNYLSKPPGKINIFFNETWPRLVQIALEMPHLFPGHSLDHTYSTSREYVFAFSRRQIACLVIHQFLCSLPSHPWRTQSFVDLRVWYSSSAASSHRSAMHAYLTALFTYFERVTSSAEDSILGFELKDWPIIFTLKTLPPQDIEAAKSLKERPFCSVDFVQLSESKTSPEYLGLNNGACVIAANKSVGLGPAATQEELQVGSTPEAYPISLLVQPLEDNQVLVVQGAEAMVSIRGYGVEAWLEEILEPDYSEQVKKSGKGDSVKLASKWQSRTMLFMDAIQFDFDPASPETANIIQDLQLGNLSRELWKAYNAFDSTHVMRSENKTTVTGIHSRGPYSVVATGLWGCGTFGGDKHIKSMIQWCAASMAQVRRLQFITSTTEQHVFAEAFKGFIDRMTHIVDRPPHVADVFGILVELEREMGVKGHVAVRGNEIFEYVLQSLSEKSVQ